ncbi:hypothetical protein DPMN_143680 [Dreissena polymorpha]|uniref:Uncharacterized protein n=1 Tax=Dreissena polymorpha TaxID=45954 RepID=A0A9D4GGT7_DREPO|nr:hypothetical protein DPMN_143680 [Dreissena polymorpha]
MFVFPASVVGCGRDEPDRRQAGIRKVNVSSLKSGSHFKGVGELYAMNGSAGHPFIRFPGDVGMFSGSPLCLSDTQSAPGQWCRMPSHSQCS